MCLTLRADVSLRNIEGRQDGCKSHQMRDLGIWQKGCNSNDVRLGLESWVGQKCGYKLRLQVDPKDRIAVSIRPRGIREWDRR